MPKIVQLTGVLKSKKESYERMLGFYQECLRYDSIVIELRVTFLEANLVSIIGAMIASLRGEGKIVSLSSNIGNPGVKLILQKNGFLEAFGGGKSEDNNKTTIEYMRFMSHEYQKFYDYLEKNLFSLDSLPTMTKTLRQEMKKQLAEIFTNCIEHGQSEEVFVCGQYFPKLKKIEFTITNNGKTFTDNIFDRYNQDVKNSIAIKWAVQEGNSTRRDGPGGIGLHLVRKFVEMNRGKIHIISGDGYWAQDYQDSNGKIFNIIGYFPGTVVNLEFNTADNKSYRLKSEN